MENTIKIMMVDDEPDFVEPIAFWLQSKGYIVKTIFGGEKAIQAIKEEMPNIIFLDIKMPVMDGIETLRRIRKMKPDIPVVMVTAYEDEEKFSAARKLKISGFFSKKGSLEELQALIETILRTHKKLKPSK